MLKIAGAVLVIFSCSALGYSKSIHMTRRLQQLREIEKMVRQIDELARTLQTGLASEKKSE